MLYCKLYQRVVAIAKNYMLMEKEGVERVLKPSQNP